MLSVPFRKIQIMVLISYVSGTRNSQLPKGPKPIISGRGEVGQEHY